MYDKIWESHLVREVPGEPSLIYIDRHLIHEGTSPQAFAGIEAAGRKGTVRLNMPREGTCVFEDVIRGTVTLGDPGKLVIASATPLADNLFVAFMLGNLYYNVHSATFPSGEIRGQLSIVP